MNFAKNMVVGGIKRFSGSGEAYSSLSSIVSKMDNDQPVLSLILLSSQNSPM